MIVRERFRLAGMNREFVPTRLDVTGFAEAAATLHGSDPVVGYARLSAELAESAPDAQVAWTAEGESRTGSDGAPVSWLHLHAEATLPFVCQRCLAPFAYPLESSTMLVLGKDDEEADQIEEILDNESIDVIVGSRTCDIRDLLEDEALLALPQVPKHDVCPATPMLDALKSDKPSPFAGLQNLKSE